MRVGFRPDVYVRHCQFIKGYDRKGLALFCGRRSRHGASYCPEHYPRIYRRVPVFDPKRIAERAIETPAAMPGAEVAEAESAVAEEVLEPSTVE
ncbi:MAG: hypothetical protein HY525_20875 [Betaproteobacteria bacterium]|nr:hypothetical protein [Betaproteobacteria bacterium]